MKKSKRTMSLVLALALVFSLLGMTSLSFAATEENVTRTAAATPNPSTIYPLKNAPQLTYWVALPTNVETFCTDFGTLPGIEYWKKSVGANIKYISAGSSVANNQFKLLTTSKDMPDIIEHTWPGSYTGGISKAYDDGVIVDLTPNLSKWAPYLNYLFETRTDIAKQVKIDSGKILLFPFIRDSVELRTTSGPVVRGDMLKANNLSAPQTIDDWTNMLTAFAKDPNIKYPLAGRYVTGAAGTKNSELYRIFAGAYNGGYPDFYHVGTTVKYGLIEPGYKDFLTQMNAWFNAKLLDPDFSNYTSADIAARMTSGSIAATYGAGGGGLGTWQNTVNKNANNTIQFVATRFPSLKKGEKQQYGEASGFEFTSNGHAAVTQDCKNVETAMRVLDYAYSEPGHLAINFGEPGVSYNMVGGKPTFTNLVMKNPDGLTVAQAMSKYGRSNANFPGVQSLYYITQFYELQTQKDALVLWRDQDSIKTFMPPISMTSAENREFSKIMTSINTYAEAETLKFIKGTRPLSEFNTFVSKLKSMGINNAIKYQQAALARYNKR